MKTKLLISILLIAASLSGVFAQTGSSTNASVPAGKRADKITPPKATGTLDVLVSDGEGNPFPDARVYVSPVGKGVRAREGATDESGKFHVGNLPLALYHVEVAAPSFIESSPNGSPTNESRAFRPGETVNIQLVPGGVITGTVTDRDGNPIVGLTVNATRIYEPGDSSEDRINNFFGEGRPTDDRGIYRMYGLRPGRYVVYAGGHTDFSRRSTPFDKDAPTYYPSSTRDTGSVVNVSSGQEYSGIDIRYRNEPGYQVTGFVSGQAAKDTELSLTVPGNPAAVGLASVFDQDGRRVFAFTGIPSGNYKITARGIDEKHKSTSAGSVKASVQGADLSGVEVKLLPMASLGGHVVLNGKADPKCGSAPTGSLDSIVFKLRSDKKDDNDIFSLILALNEISPNDQGEFQFSGLTPGSYRLRPVIPEDHWYIQSFVKQVAKPSTVVAQKNNVPADVSQSDFFLLTSGENVTGLTANISQDGGSLSGSTSSSPAAATAIPRLVLVPLEKERAENTLRYAETGIERNGRFAFHNLAPGKYRLVYRIQNLDSQDITRPFAWNAKERANLLHDAETVGIPVEIKPCQSLNDVGLIFAADGSMKLQP